MATFDDLWNSVSAWAEQQAQLIEATGRPLTSAEAETAKKVGVLAPDRIRIKTVEVVPFPDDPLIQAVATRTGLGVDSSGAMTLGHGIFMREDQAGRPDLWRHEFRHVAQYECFGSIKAFMFFYLKELLHFNYGAGPLEIDAQKAEQI